MPDKTTMTVDEYVRVKVPPQHRETVAMLRDLVRECAPQAEELVSYGMPVFKDGKIFAWIIPYAKHVTFGFRVGSSFRDEFDLLRGTGKHARNIKIKPGDGIGREVLLYYIRQALELNAN